MAAVKGYKNPLAVALGMVFRRTRDVMNRSSKEIAEEIGIKASFYRLIESGTNHLHISKTLSVVDAFEGRLSFDGIMKTLTCISVMEVYGKSAEKSGSNYLIGVREAIEKFKEYDSQRLRFLFQPLNEDFFDQWQTDTEKPIFQFEFDTLLQKFLEDYSSFGKSFGENNRRYISQFFDKLPSIYIESLERQKDSLLDLPVKVGFEVLSDWEEKNKAKLRSLKIIVSNIDLIFKEENLLRYHYNYLWEEKFENVNIIYFEGPGENQAKEVFLSNLSNGIKEADITNRKTEQIAQKVRFCQCIECPELKSYKDFLSQIRDGKYNSMWVFSLIGGKNVGFTAKIKSADASLTTGKSMTYPRTIQFMEKFEEIWKS